MPHYESTHSSPRTNKLSVYTCYSAFRPYYTINEISMRKNLKRFASSLYAMGLWYNIFQYETALCAIKSEGCMKVSVWGSCIWHGCIIMMVASLAGCIEYTWKTEDTGKYSCFSHGVIYELRQPVWVDVESGRTSSEIVGKYRVEITKGTTVVVDHVVSCRGFGFWWYFGAYAIDEVFGIVVDGERKGQRMCLNDLTRRCRKCVDGEWQLYNVPDEEWLKKR